MADVLQGLVFDLSLKTANLVKGVSESNNILNGFKDQISNIGNLISGAFTVTAIIGAGKALADFALRVGESTAAVRDLTGQSEKGLTDLTASLLSTSQTFGTDFNQTLQSTNALARNLGISFQDASHIIQTSIALNDDKANDLLGVFQQFSPTIKELGINANDLAGLVTHIGDSGQNIATVFESFAKAGKNLRDANQQTRDDLQAIGVNVDDLQQKVLSGSITEFDAVMKISSALQNFSSNSAEAGKVLTDVFGKGAVTVGVDFYKELSKVNLGLDETLKNADAVEVANLRIATATEEINKVTVELFGNSSTLWTQMKAGAYELAANALKQVQLGLLNASNFFIELYNNSLLFRTVIQLIALNFKGLYDTVAAFASILFDTFSGAAKLIKAILTGSFKDIPSILAEGFDNVKNDVVNSATDIFNDFKDAFENVAHNKPIDLIDVSQSTQQATVAGTQAGQAYATAFASGDYTDKLKPISNKNSLLAKTPTPKPLPDNFNTQIKASNEQLGYTYSLVEKVGMSFKENISNNAVNSINLLGQTIAANVGKGVSSLADFGNAVVNTAKQVIAASLSQAIAEAILSSQEIPFPGNLIAAGIAVGAVSALFASIPSFSLGGQVEAGQNLIRMNEGGNGELAIMPTGSVIIPHDLSSKIVSGSNNVHITLDSKVSGEDLRLVLKTVERRRSNSSY